MKFKWLNSIFGTATRATIALIGIGGVSAAIANYAMTQGSGTTFGSVFTGGVHYAQQMLCDLTTPAQCASVSSGGAVKVDGTGGSFPVSGTVAATQSGTWNITNISGTVSLPTGAATAAKQPALGTAGSSSTDVLSIQGIASMTPLFVQSATVPVSTMNAANATNLGVAAAFVFDDVTPTTITENSFGYARMSSNRNIYQTIRDAAGNERGVNVDASNRLTTAPTLVSGSVASGAYASGSVASGAFASGALASGSIASGAMVDLLTMRQTVAAGTVASNSLLTGGIYNSTPITLTNGQGSATQFDANGYLKVNIAAGAAAGGTSSTFGAAFPSTGTAAGMSVGGNMVALTGTGSNLNVQCANCSGSGASATDAAAFTAGASVLAPGGGFYQTTATSNALTNGQQGMWQMTANRAGFVNLRNASGTEVGVSGAELFVGGRGTAGSAAGGVLSVQGVASMTPVQVSQATASNLNATVVGTGTFAVQANPGTAANWGIVAQGSTTSGQVGVLNQAAVTTSAPTYTTAQTAPLSLDTSGNLRVSVTSSVGLAQGSTTSGQTGSLVMGAVTTSAPSYTTAQTSPVSLDTSGNLRVNCATGCTAGTAASTTGNIAANNTTAVVVKASAGTLMGVQVYGIGSAPAYLKIYNATSATCGSGTPVKRLMIPAAATAANGAGSNISFGDGIAFSTGITYCVTTGITDADTTAPAASTFLVNIDWK